MTPDLDDLEIRITVPGDLRGFLALEARMRHMTNPQVCSEIVRRHFAEARDRAQAAQDMGLLNIINGRSRQVTAKGGNDAE
jgi:hypothetical protein